MKYICTHGYVYMSCDICSEMVENLQRLELFGASSDELTEAFGEDMYDYYLDLDERSMREMEEN